MTDEQREAIEAGAKTMEWVATMPNSAMLRYAIVLRSMLTTRPAPSPSDAAFGKGIPTSLEVAWDDFAQRKGIAPHSVNAYAVEFARERCADLQAQFRANMEQAPSPSREGWLERGSIEKWRTSFKVCYTALGHAELDTLCDMALSALRPAGDEGVKHQDQLNAEYLREVWLVQVGINAALEAVRHCEAGNGRPFADAVQAVNAQAALHTEKKEGL